jgi:hypothetical protein
MPLLKDRVPSDRFRALIWGKSGVGKTELLATFAAAGKMAVAECDVDGLDVAKSKDFKIRHPNLDVDNLIEAEPFWNPVDDFGLPATLDGLWKMQRWLNEKARDPSIKTLAIDSLTYASMLAEPIAMKANSERGLSKSWGFMGKSHVMITQIQDKGVESNIIMQLINGIMRADKHIVIIAHEREKFDEKTQNVVGIEPQLTGTKARAGIGKPFREIWYLDVATIVPDPKKPMETQNVRVLHTQPTGMIKIAKTTLGVKDRMVNPTYEKIMKSIGA